MRPDLPAPRSVGFRKRNLDVKLYPVGETPGEVALGSATGSTTITNDVLACTQTDDSAQLCVRASMARPESGQVISIRDVQGSEIWTVFNGVVETVGGVVQRDEERAYSITLRRRDADPYWRQTRRVGGHFFVGSELASMARAALADAGLAATEYDLPDFGVRIGQGQFQLSDLSLWDMLRIALLPGSLEPFVDARGYVKAISRNVQRPACIELDDRAVLSFEWQTSRPPVTGVRVKYTDPQLAEVEQPERLLASETVSVGFFNGSEQRQVWFSPDRRTRVRGARMVTKHGAGDNDWANPIHAGEAFTQTSPYGGVIGVEVDAGASSSELRNRFLIESGGVGAASVAIAAGGATGIAGAAALGVLLTDFFNSVTKQGTGVYEIWGRPYDYVQVINEVECYDEDAPVERENVEDLESALIPNEATAVALATAELLFRVRSAKSARMTILDDYRVEPGDLLRLPEQVIAENDLPAGARFCVLPGMARDLMQGPAAGLMLPGFVTW